MAALSAIRHNPVSATFYQRRVNGGRPGKTRVVLPESGLELLQGLGKIGWD